MKPHPAPPRHTPTQHPRRKIPLYLPAITLLALILILGIIGVIIARQDRSPSPGIAAPPSPTDPAVQTLLGQWARTDGDYIIHIHSISNDGQVSASYLNPQPIHVSRAQLTGAAESLTLTLELRDTGYPGNYYTLTHNPNDDTLNGTYHQLGQGQTYPVTFQRLPAPPVQSGLR